MKQRGQAALEFLTTYGWMFIIAIGAVGAMAYLGVFSPQQFLPVTCNLDQGLTCPLFSMNLNTTNARLVMQIVNNNNDRVEITRFRIKDRRFNDYCQSTSLNNETGGPLSLAERTLGIGESQEFYIEFSDNANCVFSDAFDGSTTKKRVDVRMYYRKGSATQESLIEGYLIVDPDQY